jgi:IclR family acetate operon transcriptional repressor
MRCLAAPIFNEFGEVVAGISISGPAGRLSASRMADYGPLVRACADEVTRMIGGSRR